MPQKQIKITVSQRLHNIIEKKAKALGVTKAFYCQNLIFEHIRKEVENNEED